MNERVIVGALFCVCLAGIGRPVAAQPQTTPAKITFREATDRALARNPTVQQAAAEILRAQSLLQAATAAILPTLNGSAVGTMLNEGQYFGGNVATPRNQLTLNVSVSGLLFAPVQWALRVQAAENEQVVRFAARETRRQIALATAQVYLAVIAQERVLDADVRARDVAREHENLARRLREQGAGSRLNEVRALQSVSADEVLVEQAEQGLYSAQEALGILVAEQGPMAAADEPDLEAPASLQTAVDALPNTRPDLLVAAAREHLAARVVSDSWKDRLPSVTGMFQPQYVNPSTLFQPTWSWRAQVAATVPIFDFGLRRAQKAGREALLSESIIAKDAVLRQARSEVRVAEEAVRRAERALASARAAAEQAGQVVEIVNVSFKAGASTDIEVIDAQRAARDADTAVALVANQLRQAKLSLLVALGQFPS